MEAAIIAALVAGAVSLIGVLASLVIARQNIKAQKDVQLWRVRKAFGVYHRILQVTGQERLLYKKP